MRLIDRGTRCRQRWRYVPGMAAIAILLLVLISSCPGQVEGNRAHTPVDKTTRSRPRVARDVSARFNGGDQSLSTRMSSSGSHRPESPVTESDETTAEVCRDMSCNHGSCVQMTQGGRHVYRCKCYVGFTGSQCSTVDQSAGTPSNGTSAGGMDKVTLLALVAGMVGGCILFTGVTFTLLYLCFWRAESDYYRFQKAPTTSIAPDSTTGKRHDPLAPQHSVSTIVSLQGTYTSGWAVSDRSIAGDAPPAYTADKGNYSNPFQFDRRKHFRKHSLDTAGEPGYMQFNSRTAGRPNGSDYSSPLDEKTKAEAAAVAAAVAAARAGSPSGSSGMYSRENSEHHLLPMTDERQSRPQTSTAGNNAGANRSSLSPYSAMSSPGGRLNPALSLQNDERTSCRLYRSKSHSELPEDMPPQLEDMWWKNHSEELLAAVSDSSTSRGVKRSKSVTSTGEGVRKSISDKIEGYIPFNRGAAGHRSSTSGSGPEDHYIQPLNRQAADGGGEHIAASAVSMLALASPCHGLTIAAAQPAGSSCGLTSTAGQSGADPHHHEQHRHSSVSPTLSSISADSRCGGRLMRSQSQNDLIDNIDGLEVDGGLWRCHSEYQMHDLNDADFGDLCQEWAQMGHVKVVERSRSQLAGTEDETS